MLNKLTAVTLVAALLIVLGGTSAFANNISNPDAKTATDVPSGAPARKEVEPNEQLKNNMLKLVADAKAGKIAPAERPQIRPAQGNNLSKGTKIAIGVGIAVAVIAVILIVYSPALNDGQ